MHALLKRLARLLLGDYAPYYIYAAGPAAPAQAGAPALRVAQVEQAALLASAEALLREQAGYGGESSVLFACFDGARMVGLCAYWHGARYRRRNFWPLQADEIKLVQIITLPDMRGRAVAATLIAQSHAILAAQGWRQAYARIWHSNTPSIRAFENAGWQRIALVVEIFPFGRKKAVRLVRRVRAASLKVE